jgi:hypothetical protein
MTLYTYVKFLMYRHNASTPLPFQEGPRFFFSRRCDLTAVLSAWRLPFAIELRTKLSGQKFSRGGTLLFINIRCEAIFNNSEFLVGVLGSEDNTKLKTRMHCWAVPGVTLQTLSRVLMVSSQNKCLNPSVISFHQELTNSSAWCALTHLQHCQS